MRIKNLPKISDWIENKNGHPSIFNNHADSNIWNETILHEGPRSQCIYVLFEVGKNPVFSMWCVINYIVLLMYKIIVFSNFVIMITWRKA